jgi:hypothetical protein
MGREETLDAAAAIMASMWVGEGRGKREVERKCKGSKIKKMWLDLKRRKSAC